MIIENQNFHSMVKSGALGQAQNYLGNVTRQLLRENGFNGAIAECKPVNPSDCRPRTDSLGLSYFTYVEPESGASVLSFRGDTPVNQYVSAGQVEIPFNFIRSRAYTIKTEDLMFYPFPITKMIEDNIIYDLHEAQDHYTINNALIPAVLRTGKWAVYNGSFDKLGARMGFDLIAANRLRASKILFADQLYNQLVTQGSEFFGHEMNSQVVTSGYTASTFGNRTLIQSIKSTLLTRNPYAANDVTAIGIYGVSAVNGLSAPGSARGTVPYDPYYKIGVNLSGLKAGGDAANATYPVADLINGAYVAGVSNASLANTLITANGGTTYKGGGTIPSSTASATDPSLPTTKKWLGNTAFFLTDEETFAKNFMLKDVEFEIQQIDWMLKFQARQAWAFGVTNANGAAMVVFNPPV